MDNELVKNCPKCGEIQKYTTKSRLKSAIKENWYCNNCSITHQKKIYDFNTINEIKKLYNNGFSFSKIAIILKIKRTNVKNILVEENMWVEERDNVEKKFTQEQINDIKQKYKEGNSIKKISEKYNISVTPIKRILKDENILRKGNSNGKKIILTEDEIKTIENLYLNEYRNSDYISNYLGLTKSFINKFLSNCGFRRNRSIGNSVGLITRFRGVSYNEYLELVNDYKKYKNDVMRITKQQPIHKLINYEKRGNSGVEGAYHLDHKYSIIEGFKNNISPTIIGNMKNLEFITWEENIKKRTKCSITINELINN
jgi:DNA-binding transcriptional MerR regulator